MFRLFIEIGFLVLNTPETTANTRAVQHIRRLDSENAKADTPIKRIRRYNSSSNNGKRGKEEIIYMNPLNSNSNYLSLRALCLAIGFILFLRQYYLNKWDFFITKIIKYETLLAKLPRKSPHLFTPKKHEIPWQI